MGVRWGGEWYLGGSHLEIWVEVNRVLGDWCLSFGFRIESLPFRLRVYPSFLLLFLFVVQGFLSSVYGLGGRIHGLLSRARA